MIYGDNPDEENPQPDLEAIIQSGNLYAYCLDKPTSYQDKNGQFAFLLLTAFAGAVAGGIIGGIVSAKNKTSWWKGALIGAGIGGVIGTLGGGAFAYFATGSTTASTSMVIVGTNLKIAGASAVGYETFQRFKYDYGRAGDGRAWHHIVLETAENIKRFGAEVIHKASNIVNIPHGAGTLHQMITNHYNSLMKDGSGLRVYEWLQTLSYNEQFAYGLKKLTEYARELGISIEYAKK